MKLRRTRVALLVGGPSAEHDLSLLSGRTVHKYLDRDKFDVSPILIDRRGRWPIEIEHLPKMADIAFVGMHGEYGEDGTLQEVLRDLEVPYTGSDPVASALAINKPLVYRILRASGIRVPKAEIIGRHNARYLNIDRVRLPVVVRPSNKGSLTGVSVVRRTEDLEKAINKALAFNRTVLVEDFIPGRELSCGVMDDGMGNIFPLPIVEEVVRPSISSGYNPELAVGSLPEIILAHLTPEEMGTAQAAAVRAHQAVGASGISRLRMTLGEDGELYGMEINTVPVMAEASFFPRAAIAHGIGIPEMLERIIDAAFVRHRSLK